ncbi:hypothetical protein HDU86_005508 [Geranomyces michiganensis]|nr:hypothetical protein HDU86_005508 [Geranomyces michiganensis]
MGDLTVAPTQVEFEEAQASESGAPFDWQYRKRYTLPQNWKPKLGWRELVKALATAIKRHADGNPQELKSYYEKISAAVRRSLEEWYLSDERYDEWTKESEIARQHYHSRRAEALENRRIAEEDGEVEDTFYDDCGYEESASDTPASESDALSGSSDASRDAWLNRRMNESEDNTLGDWIDMCFPEGDYSWFLQDIIHGELEIEEEFFDGMFLSESAQVLYQKHGIDADLAKLIIGACWFANDWTFENLDELNYPSFLVSGWIRMLKKLDKEEDRVALDIRNAISRAQQARERQMSVGSTERAQKAIYNESFRARDLSAMQQSWSVFTRLMRAAIQNRSADGLDMSSLSTGKVQRVVDRATERLPYYRYTVHLAPRTKWLVYKDQHTRAFAHMNLRTALKDLKTIGVQLESFRVGKDLEKRNILVPLLFLVASNSREELRFEGVPLPRQDGVSAVKSFDGPSDEYSIQANKDILAGQKLKGDPPKAWEPRADRLHHSERALLQFLRSKPVQQEIVKNFLAKSHENLAVHTAALLLYSTNSVCTECAATLLGALEDRTDRSVVSELKKAFQDNKIEVKDDFRIQVIVEASVNYAPDAHDHTDTYSTDVTGEAKSIVLQFVTGRRTYDSSSGSTLYADYDNQCFISGNAVLNLSPRPSPITQVTPALTIAEDFAAMSVLPQEPPRELTEAENVSGLAEKEPEHRDDDQATRSKSL